MAVNINTVYQRVLTIANKEQRGYITPQEFNILANQAQMDLFEQYFYDVNQFGRARGHEDKHIDPIEILKEKISLFEVYDTTLDTYSSNHHSLPTDLYRLSNVKLSGVMADNVSIKDFNNMLDHPLLRPHSNRPVYIRTSGGLKVYSNTSASNLDEAQVTSTSTVKCDYIKTPADVTWGFTTVSSTNSTSGVTTKSSLYNASTSTNFELHESEEVNLVNRILVLSGVVIRDDVLVRTIGAEEINDIKQEKG
tara:strand:- start:1459 stop:2211 length:753 start_codon:yes stop_codon:yes gene_type:complete